MKLHRFTSTIDLAQPLDEVFARYSAFPQHPSSMQDMARRAIPGLAPRDDNGRPLGNWVQMPMKVTERRTNRLIRFRSCNRRCSSARWQVRFRSLGPSLTRVDEELLLPLAMFGRWTA